MAALLAMVRYGLATKITSRQTHRYYKTFDGEIMFDNNTNSE